MRPFLFLFIAGCFALAGCQGKQAQLSKLNAEYQTAHQQYVNDCIAPAQGGTDAYFKGDKPKVATPQEEAAHNQKCAQELAQTKTLEQQIAAISK
jgi:hypothetical protein